MQQHRTPRRNQRLTEAQVPANWWQGTVDRGLLFPKEVDVSEIGSGGLTVHDDDDNGIGCRSHMVPIDSTAG